LQPPFDIAADLDTPVSAYLKLKPFQPRFLLESVEGGERLARYSFIGFGDCLEVRLDERGLSIDGRIGPPPQTQAELLSALRSALARAPQPSPQIPGVPLPGGLVGASSYDLVRRFERLPPRIAMTDPTPEAHYLAPRSLLVFDHLTRGVALLSYKRYEAASHRATSASSIPPRSAVSAKTSSSRVSIASRNTSHRATSISWCCRCALPACANSNRSKRIARCGC
jgi:anthranilate/para-aminobenzoate synthase component I